MADVKIIDIDNEQWNVKDQAARDRLNIIENLIPSNASKNNKLIPQSILSNYFEKTENLSFLSTKVNKNQWVKIENGVYLVETDVHFVDSPMHLYLIGKYTSGCNVWEICGSNVLTLGFSENGIKLNTAPISEAFLNVVRIGNYG